MLRFYHSCLPRYVGHSKFRAHSEKGGAGMADTQSILDSFILDEDVAELSMVDDLWYFIEKGGDWVAGSG